MLIFFSELINKEVKADIVAKAESSIQNMLFNKVDKINFSELVQKYREHIISVPYKNYSEEYSQFKLSFKQNDSPYLEEWYDLELYLPSSIYKSEEVSISLRNVKSDNNDTDQQLVIRGIRYDNRNLEKLSLGNKSDFEVLLINLLMNKTTVVMDVHENDISTYLYED